MGSLHSFRRRLEKYLQFEATPSGKGGLNAHAPVSETRRQPPPAAPPPHTPQPAAHPQARIQSAKLTQLLQALPQRHREQRGPSCSQPPPQRHRQQTALFVLAVVGVTGVTGQRFYNQPTLDVNTVAPQTLFAPRDATVVNQKLTEERRKAVTTAAVPVLQVDAELSQQQKDSLIRIFRHGNELRARLGPFPVISTALLSSDVQRHLRQLNSNDWQQILRSLESSGRGGLPPALPDSSLSRKALGQLQRYRERAAAPDFSQLLERLLEMRRQYGQANALLQNPDLAELNAAYGVELFDLSEKDWEQLKPAMSLALDRLLTQGIPAGLSETAMEQAIALHIQIALPNPRWHRTAQRLLGQVLRPNLTQDVVATQRKAERAAESVADVLVSVRAGEVIVKEGEQISLEQLVLLDEFNLSQRGANWRGLIGFGGVILVEIAIFVGIQQRFGPRFRRRDWMVISMLAVTTPLLFALRLPISSLPAVGLLIGSFYGSPLGVTAVGLLSATLPLGLEMDMQMLLASATSGIVGALVAGRLRSREELALLGLGVGFTQGAVHLLLSLIMSAATGSVWYLLLRGALLHALRGIAWSIVALGVSPYLERLFDLITPIRMAELSNPNRPLLQRLAAETPGTFQHTLFVSTLAEAAARTLGCNVELVRAGTLYHDIGKMHDPEGFIENQMGGPNKHDLINDPWKSAAIIKKHVTEGQIMARRCRLPRALQSFIPEHQGTMRISYFYQQAQKLVAEHPDRYSLKESDFRYDGPIPQSRETGIVMLADSCEAALRSLKEATSEEALTMVKRIIRARWKDDQLCESGLSRDDLDRIATVFVQIWQQFHHKRIPYPASPPRPPALSPS